MRVHPKQIPNRGSRVRITGNSMVEIDSELPAIPREINSEAQDPTCPMCGGEMKMMEIITPNFIGKTDTCMECGYHD